LFGDLMNLVWSDYARMIYHVQVTLQEDPAAARQPAPLPTRTPSPAASSATGGARVSYSGGTPAPSGAQALAAVAGAPGVEAAAQAGGFAAAGAGVPGVNGDSASAPPVVQQRHVEAEPGRNDPCWCGSGRKYKKCHGA
jgi:preprotein translocase subunit SecA